MVDGGSETDCEGDGSWCNTKGDLVVFVSAVIVEPKRKEEIYTRSASESNSWPIRLAFCLHRATLPSMKSKKSPNGMKARAA